MKTRFILTCVLWAGSSLSVPANPEPENPAAVDFLAVISAPSGRIPAGNQKKPVVIAIVDDAFRTTHEELRPFLWQNPREIPGNRVDDDGNGHVDDVSGWDISDNDSEVMPPPGREALFNHGTHLAGIIARIATHVYGDKAHEVIRILPVKCLSDDAEKPYLKDGYKGIQYAADAGADIILTAWNESFPGIREKQILQQAHEQGSLIIAPAGNFPEEEERFPAAFPPAFGVTSVESTGRKTETANFGAFVDLSAPGTGILAASSASDNDRRIENGTSMSAAIVAAAAAILKVDNPQAPNPEILARLKNTATPMDGYQAGDVYMGGKLGAGRLNLSAALAYSLQNEPRKSNITLNSHQGYLAWNHSQDGLVLWKIRPEGPVDGFWFEPAMLSGDPGSSRLQLFQPDSDASEPFLDLSIREWQERTFIPGNSALVLLFPDSEKNDFTLLVEYASQPVDQRILYCGDTVTMREEGILEDGSGALPYSPKSDCKWLITAPPGKVVHFEFLQFDTEARTDWVYFFNGSGTHEDIMAGFSGPRVPPELTTWGNQVLVWFVTNDSVQGQGWKAVVSFVDAPDPS